MPASASIPASAHNDIPRIFDSPPVPLVSNPPNDHTPCLPQTPSAHSSRHAASSSNPLSPMDVLGSSDLSSLLAH
ncbi:hypothetical protein Hypma_014562 [Hypsizygus marmoreus]|uniref:Uncharacterized protein n=1 Tax=Hypsizygus marmoreus TaxID=39966 RepID=A0A369JHD3_HYPMA|nr:hypothetical protein Hypma_014562 [Hypsizygus marmoreus]